MHRIARRSDGRTHTRALRRVAMAAALVGTSLAAAPASALTVLQAPLSELVEASEYVLHGTIAKVEVLDQRRAKKGVWTEYTLRVTEVLKSGKRKLGKTFSWRLVGGTTKDGMTLSVPGMPTFVQGEETVVLLEKHSAGHTLTGAPQGKFHVAKDKKGRKVVRRDLLGAHLIRRDARTGRLISSDKHGHGVELTKKGAVQTLAALRAEILGYVKAQARAARNATAKKAAAPKATDMTRAKRAGKKL